MPLHGQESPANHHQPQSPVSRAVIKLGPNKATLCRALSAPSTNLSPLLWLGFPRCLTSSSALAGRSLAAIQAPGSSSSSVYPHNLHSGMADGQFVLAFTATTSDKESVADASQFHHHQTVSQSKQTNIKEQFALERI